MILLFFTFYRILYLYLLILLLFVFDAFHPYLNQNKSILMQKDYILSVLKLNILTLSHSHISHDFRFCSKHFKSKIHLYYKYRQVQLLVVHFYFIQKSNYNKKSLSLYSGIELKIQIYGCPCRHIGYSFIRFFAALE